MAFTVNQKTSSPMRTALAQPTGRVRTLACQFTLYLRRCPLLLICSSSILRPILTVLSVFLGCPAALVGPGSTTAPIVPLDIVRGDGFNHNARLNTTKALKATLITPNSIHWRVLLTYCPNQEILLFATQFLRHRRAFISRSGCLLSCQCCSIMGIASDCISSSSFFSSKYTGFTSPQWNINSGYGPAHATFHNEVISWEPRSWG